MRARLMTILIVVAMATIGLAAPAPVGAATPCRARNATQGTSGRLHVLVAAARDGDRLLVRGMCDVVPTIHITRDLTIVGVGERRAVLAGDAQHRVVWVGRGARVVLRHVAVILGNAGYRGTGGGGIRNDGDLTLIDAAVHHNTSQREGAGIANRGSLHLVGTVVAWNWAGVFGSGISNHGTLTLSGSVVRGNYAEEAGGGIANDGTLTLIDSEVRANESGNEGGGIRNASGRVRLKNGSSVTGNGSVQGGGIWNDTADATVTLSADSTVTGNTPDDCFGTPAC